MGSWKFKCGHSRIYEDNPVYGNIHLAMYAHSSHSMCYNHSYSSISSSTSNARLHGYNSPHQSNLQYNSQSKCMVLEAI